MVRNTILFVVIALMIAACGGSKASTEGAVEIAPMDELKAIQTDLDSQLGTLLKPISDVDVVVGKVTELPTKLNIDAKSLMTMASNTVQNGQIQLDATLNVAAEAKTEIEAVLGEVKVIVDGLKATPENVTALTAKLAEITAKVPLLVTKITTEAKAKLANPLASVEAKAAAQAEVDVVAQVQTEVMTKIQEVQGKATELPGMATQALSKLTTSFTVGG